MDQLEDHPGAQRRFQRRLVLGTAVGLALSTVFFVNQRFILLDNPMGEAQAAATHGPDGSNSHAPGSPGARYIGARRQAWRHLLADSGPAVQHRAGTRHRLIETTRPGESAEAFRFVIGDTPDFALTDPSMATDLDPGLRVSDPQRMLRMASRDRSGDHYAFRASPVSPVPEPSSWVLMIGGIAIAGMALRRQTHGRADRSARPPA